MGPGQHPLTPYTTRRGDWRETETETETGRPRPRDWSPRESRRPTAYGDLSASAPSCSPTLGWSALRSPLPVRLVGAPASSVPACRPLRPRRPQPRSPPNEPTRRPPAQVPPTLQVAAAAGEIQRNSRFLLHPATCYSIESQLSVLNFDAWGFRVLLAWRGACHLGWRTNGQCQ